MVMLTCWGRLEFADPGTPPSGTILGSAALPIRSKLGVTCRQSLNLAAFTKHKALQQATYLMFQVVLAAMWS